MKKSKTDSIVPRQQTGKAIETRRSILFDQVSDAKRFFEIAKDRLLNVNAWGKIAGAMSAEFQLVDADGHLVNRRAQNNDYLRIDIPGPGTISGDGYDWVKIEEIEIVSSDDEDSYAFRVRPTQNPMNEHDDVSHFYSKDSTSTFIVSRKENVVTAAVFDRNTQPNKASDLAVDKIRDTVVGTAGVLSFSKFQWSKLVDGLLEHESL